MAATTLSTQTMSEMVHKLGGLSLPPQSLRGWLRSLRYCFVTSNPGIHRPRRGRTRDLIRHSGGVSHGSQRTLLYSVSEAWPR